MAWMNGALTIMGKYCVVNQSGLTLQVLNSKLSTQDAETQLLEFIQAHAEPKVGILAGNSVHVDKEFLMREMPRICEYLHYRILDVSTVKEIAFRWYPRLEPYRKKLSHRALDDIEESIGELKYYKAHVFK
jgi:oligoribonuclease